MAKNPNFLDEQCRYLLKMANEIKDDEKRFHFVYTHISSVEECMPKGEEKGKLVKAMSSWALKEFNVIDKFKSDKRMLDLWRLLGKYSEDMKMEGVLENVYRLGFFNNQPAFYLLWAEHWASLGNRRNFDNTIRMCESNCGISSAESMELFKSLTAKYFEGPEATTGNCDNTMALIRMIAAHPEDVRPDLTLFNPTMENAQTHHHQQCSSSVEKQSDQPKQQQPSTLFAANNREEFSVFRDNDDGPITTATNMAQQQKQVEEKSKMLSAKTTTTTSTAQIHTGQKPLNNNNNKKHKEEEEAKKLDQMAAKGPRESMMFGENPEDITVSGAHGKFASSMFTSTPRRSVLLSKFDPMLVMDMDDDGLLGGPIPQEVNEEDKEKDGGLFAAPSEIGGSRLQRRLSLAGDQLPQSSEKGATNQMAGIIERIKKSSANDIVKAMPGLRIGSTIEEETEGTQSIEF